MDYRDRDFEGETILLDGNTFTGCVFRNCTIQFAGRRAPIVLSACSFRGVRFEFIEHALLTVQMIRRLGHSDGGDGLLREIVSDLSTPMDRDP